MQSRKIRLEDGRYLIFYTFDEASSIAVVPSVAGEGRESSAPPPEPRASSAREEPAAPQPQAEEERRV